MVEYDFINLIAVIMYNSFAFNFIISTIKLQRHYFANKGLSS